MNALYVAPQIAKRFQNVLREEGLFNYPQFFKSTGAKELPLFSRDSQVDFLNTLTDEEADGVVMKLALAYLEKVMRAKPPLDFLAAITFLECDDDKLLVPHIFVYTGSTQELYSQIELEEPSSSMSERLIKALQRVGVEKQYDVLQDSSAIVECARIFVGHKLHPKASLIPMQSYKRKLSTGKRR